MKKQFFIFFIFNIFIFQEFQAEPVRHRFRLFSPEYKTIVTSLYKAIEKKNKAEELSLYWKKKLKDEEDEERQIDFQADDIMHGPRLCKHMVRFHPNCSIPIFTDTKCSCFSHEKDIAEMNRLYKDNPTFVAEYREKYYEARENFEFATEEWEKIQKQHDELLQELKKQEAEQLLISLQTIGEGDVQI